MTMTPYGLLKIQFSKQILPLVFDNSSSEGKRNLQQESLVALEDAVIVRIDDEDKVLDKSIVKMVLGEVKNTFFTI